MNTIEDLSDKLEQAKRLKREYETIGYENFLFEYGLQELRKWPTGIYFPNKCVMDNDEFYSYVGYVANEEKRKLLEKYLNDSCLDLEFNLKTIGEAIEIIDYEYEESQIRNVSNWNEYITSDNIEKKENWFKKTFRKIFKIGEQKNEN
jgi:hypothetical protein